MSADCLAVASSKNPGIRSQAADQCRDQHVVGCVLTITTLLYCMNTIWMSKDTDFKIEYHPVLIMYVINNGWKNPMILPVRNHMAFLFRTTWL
jgi:hypothetical protein